MKTTIEMPQSLFEELQFFAQKNQKTMKEIIQSAVKLYIHKSKIKKGQFKLKKATFKGTGLQPGLDQANWSQIRALVYEGRGE